MSAEWLDHAPVEALQCRTLRHQWPRMTRKAGAQKLPTSGPIAWRARGAVEGGRILEREMTCIGGCGTVRTETFLIRHDGRMVREGHPRYSYGGAYLRKRADADEPPLTPLDHDDLLGALVRRLYPRLRW